MKTNLASALFLFVVVAGVQVFCADTMDPAADPLGSHGALVARSKADDPQKAICFDMGSMTYFSKGYGTWLIYGANEWADYDKEKEHKLQSALKKNRGLRVTTMYNWHVSADNQQKPIIIGSDESHIKTVTPLTAVFTLFDFKEGAVEEAIEYVSQLCS